MQKELSTEKKRVDEFQRSLSQRVSEVFVRYGARMIFLLAFRIRFIGSRNFPEDEGALVCANHQSYLDPVLVGAATTRRLNYLARKTLFKSKFFARLISFWDAIPIDRDNSGIGGIKESLKRLRRGEMLLIFPEGTRTEDGELREFKPGFISLARRGRVPIVPVGYDGAFNAWPRKSKFPHPAVIHMCIGEPIPVERIKELSDDELIAEVEERIRECFEKARAIRRR